MKKHSLIFTIAAALAIITIACNVLSTAPATPQGWQPGHPPQPPLPGQPPAPTQSSGPQPDVQGPAPSEQILLDQTVTIPGGGGGADVSFKASSGQRVRILLTASNAGVEPYGSLQYPDGTSVYNPPINTAVNGANQVEIPINQTGQYTLTLFDGSNQGGPVAVKITALE
jgi:hypothetical protein